MFHDRPRLPQAPRLRAAGCWCWTRRQDGHRRGARSASLQVGLRRGRGLAAAPGSDADQTFMTLMRLLPKSALSAAVGMATRARLPRALHHAAMRAFARRVRVDLDEAEAARGRTRPSAQFFTRKLKAGPRRDRPGDEGGGLPGRRGRVAGGLHRGGDLPAGQGHLLPGRQAAGRRRGRARAFEGGAFATLYLSPRDYHRIHAPLRGKITGLLVPARRVLAGEPGLGAHQGRAVRDQRAAGHVPGDAGRAARWSRSAPPASRASTPPTTRSSPTPGSRRGAPLPAAHRDPEGRRAGHVRDGLDGDPALRSRAR